jgi:hypothetical protein
VYLEHSTLHKFAWKPNSAPIPIYSSLDLVRKGITMLEDIHKRQP